MTASTVCAACGRPLREGARFCTGCGAAATPVLVVEAQPPLRPRGRAGASRASARPALAAAGPAGSPVTLGIAFDGVRTVHVGLRLAAYLIDAFVVLAVAAAVLFATARTGLAVLVGAELVVGLVVWEARTGCTVGNLVLGMRAARAESPYAPGLGRGVLRSLVLLAGHVVAGVGQFLVLASAGFDRSGLRQGWHDRAGRAVVVDVRGPRRGAPAGASSTATVGGTVAPAAPWAPSGPASERPAAPPAQQQPARSLAATSAAPPAAPPAPSAATGGAAARPAAPTVVILTLDTGEAMTVSGPGVIGRAPRAITGERCDHVVQIDDPERSLSRTHARFGIDVRGFWVADAGSGNGTLVVLPSGQTAVAEADRPVPVPSGSTVRLGDREIVVEYLSAR